MPNPFDPTMHARCEVEWAPEATDELGAPLEVWETIAWDVPCSPQYQYAERLGEHGGREGVIHYAVLFAPPIGDHGHIARILGIAHRLVIRDPGVPPRYLRIIGPSTNMYGMSLLYRVDCEERPKPT